MLLYKIEIIKILGGKQALTNYKFINNLTIN
jgi:hypothetical protein